VFDGSEEERKDRKERKKWEERKGWKEWEEWKEEWKEGWRGRESRFAHMPPKKHSVPRHFSLREKK
jgi:hypothetical protein